MPFPTGKRRVRIGSGMKILIAGQGKSGTTALYYKILEALPLDTMTLVEPLVCPDTIATTTLAKILIDPPGRVDVTSFDHFNFKILLVRDPRDNLISRLLYRPYNRQDFVKDETAVADLLSLLAKKEVSPSTVSVGDLITCFDRHTGIDSLPRLTGHPDTGLSFEAAHPDYHVMRYEDMIDGNWMSLSEYLQMNLSAGRAEVGLEHQRVVRSADYGQWRSWFLASDIDFFKPYFQSYIEHYGYSDDWTLEDSPSLSPQTASLYVLKLVNERRQSLSLPPLQINL